MSEHFENVARYVMSDDESELGKMRAERDYALHALEREIAIAQSEQAKSAMLVRALQRIGLACDGPVPYSRSYLADKVADIAREAILAAVGEAPK